MPSRLSHEIRAVTSDRRFDVQDAERLVTATGPTLSNTEARDLGALYDRLITRGAGTIDHPYATRGARDRLTQLFAEHGQPYGPHRTTVTQQLIDFFLVQGRGDPLGAAPRTTGLAELVLRDARPSDGTRDTVFLDAARKRAWLRVDGGGRAQPPDRWYGPFDVSKPPVPGADAPNIQPRPADLSAERSGYIAAILRAAAEARGTRFEHAELPVGVRLLDLGIMAVDRRGGGTEYRGYLRGGGGTEYRGYLVDDGRPTNELDRCWIRRETGGVATYAGPLEVPPFTDALGDGLLTYPNRARSLFYRLAHDEQLAWGDRGPDRAVHLARGKRVGGADPYFVIPRNADGSDADPDSATQVWFRSAAERKWSGPHTL